MSTSVISEADAVIEEAKLAAERAKLEASVAKSASRVMKHMNEDHEDSLVAYVLAFATGVEGTDPTKDKEDALLRNVQKGRLSISSAKMTAVDAGGFVIEIKLLENPESNTLVLSNVRVPYHKPIQSARDLHHTAVAMHEMAYEKLGVWYKTKSGYYAKALKSATVRSYESLKKSESAQKLYEDATNVSKTSVATGIAAVVAASAAASYLRSSRTAQ
eukprot:CAMPEP_0116121910 /NCGR_PEP_ID=MMETSP0329-20121206/3941_1 /TAXON_ID=697910 /ORGANISM="Pseudo-nitzschia arenysensis, Strain B593" /LENGTH=216 /DNA_ID=CAMNT_0003615739 /DNA_START=56 /DNA_END=706 /DNA_ORIENTATION=+